MGTKKKKHWTDSLAVQWSGKGMDNKPYLSDMTNKKWKEISNPDNYYSTTDKSFRLYITCRDPQVYDLMSREKMNFEVTLIGHFKFNQLQDITIQGTGFTSQEFQHANLSFDEIFSVAYNTLFRRYNWNPLKQIIETDINLLRAEGKINYDMTKIYSDLFLSLDYLAFVNFFGRNYLTNLCNKHLLNDWESYDKVVSDDGTIPTSANEIQSMKQRINRINPKYLTKWGSGTLGGKITEDGKRLLDGYLKLTNQPLELKDSVIYEARV